MMTFSWLYAAVLLMQVFNWPNGLVLTKDGEMITKINQMDFTYPYSDLPIVNMEKYEQFLNQLEKQISVPPVNASFDTHGNIVPEQVGWNINRHAFTKEIYSYFFTHKKPSMEIPMLPVYPKVDSELLGNISSMRIGQYVTVFDPQNKNRSTNIRLAARAINNFVIFPGETFSFNQVVGKRTKASGYLRAPVIVRGELSEDIGGGICQVSSTLFNAVDNAGLEIVQRFSHTRKVPYIPPGRDATVSWFGPDFEFKNNYNQPILVRSKTIGSRLIIKLYSTDGINYKPRKVPNPPY